MFLNMLFSFLPNCCQNDELEESEESLPLKEESFCKPHFKPNLFNSFRTCFCSLGFFHSSSIVICSESESDIESLRILYCFTLAPLSLDLDCDAFLCLVLQPNH